ncbi:MAG: araB [Verrucomicrobiales bacterium]|nr:araB [Verrucomicrobiales bacterium]
MAVGDGGEDDNSSFSGMSSATQKPAKRSSAITRSTSPKHSISLGLDFGTESVRALLVDLKGIERASAVVAFPHGQITRKLPGTGEDLPHNFALQHPLDWIDSAARAVRRALKSAKCAPESVIGIGVDFTSCTMLPALADGTPLCCTEKFAGEKFAWPKLWKHHGAKTQTDRINEVARLRKEPWLARYGGIIGLEWFFPKVLETLENSPRVYAATEVWLEAGDWFVWQLVGGPASQLPRSTCQAGYKGMWSRKDGFPSPAFFKALHPLLENVVGEKMPGHFLAPGEPAGGLRLAMAKRLGLQAGTPVSAAIIDAHAGVPGAGASEPGTLVMVMGTSSCHMLNSAANQRVPGVAGLVEDGILPGLFGYETGQAAVGDAFDWCRRTLGQRDFAALTAKASALPAGAQGVRCIDWMNGCRTPLMDGSLSGAFCGLTLNHGPEHLFRALLEGSACGLRWIVDQLQEHGVEVKRYVATGGLPHHNPLFLQICADMLGKPITIHPCKHGPALGAAILGALAAGSSVTGFKSVGAAIRSMAQPKSLKPQVVIPRRVETTNYDSVYADYRQLADALVALKSSSNSPRRKTK